MFEQKNLPSLANESINASNTTWRRFCTPSWTAVIGPVQDVSISVSTMPVLLTTSHCSPRQTVCPGFPLGPCIAAIEVPPGKKFSQTNLKFSSVRFIDDSY